MVERVIYMCKNSASMLILATKPRNLNQLSSVINERQAEYCPPLIFPSLREDEDLMVMMYINVNKCITLKEMMCVLRK